MRCPMAASSPAAPGPRAPSALAVCRRYSRVCRQTQATSLGQILIVLNCWDATAVSGIHPFEITGVFKRPPDNLAEPILYDFERQVLRASFVAGENAPKGCHQPIKFDRFGVELVAPRRERLFAFTGERVRGESDNGDVAGLRIALEPSRSFPAVDDRHLEVHQDDIGALGSGHLAALLAILRREHLEIAEQLEPHLEHEDVVVVVFHVKHFGHDAASIPLITSGFFCASRRMRSTRSAGRNLSLTSTDCTPELSRARSLASRSSEVMTMTGMSRQPMSFCKAATTAKPSISGIIRSSRITSGLALLYTFERLATVLCLSHSPL